MKLKLTLATATALGLLMGGAMAGDLNTGVVEQFGDDNTALIEQDGNRNRVGREDRLGISQSSYYGQQYRVIQDGGSNSLAVRQVGNANLATGGSSGNLQDSLTQTGDNNQIDVLQVNEGSTYSGNAIFRIDQDSDAGTGVANKLTIEQGGADQQSRNLTRRITQNSIDATKDNEITVKQGITAYVAGSSTSYVGGNFLYSLNQTGSGNTQDISQDGRNNFVDTVTQTGDDNSATIDQIGHKNVIDSLTQDGNGNSAAVELRGNNNGGSASQNGSSPWGGATSLEIRAFSAGSRAEGVGIAQGVFLQDGGYNDLDHSVTGNDNLTGVQQLGDSNNYTGTVVGDRNELALLQDGNGNNSSVVLTGDDNNVGVKSIGDGNTADVTHAGDSNQNSVWQIGNDNLATVSVIGDGNNAGGFSLSPASVLATSASLTPGLLEQYGSGNQVSLNVTGDSNVFASRQGLNASPLATSNNKITATQEGDSNQAAVVQAGSSNVAALSQVGNGNSISISQ